MDLESVGFQKGENMMLVTLDAQSSKKHTSKIQNSSLNTG